MEASHGLTSLWPPCEAETPGDQGPGGTHRGSFRLHGPRPNITTDMNQWAFQIFLQSTGIPAYSLSEAKLWQNGNITSDKGTAISNSRCKGYPLSTLATECCLSLSLHSRAACPSPSSPGLPVSPPGRQGHLSPLKCYTDNGN